MIEEREDLSCVAFLGEIATSRDAAGRPVHRGWPAAGGRRRWMAPFVLVLLAQGPSYGYALIRRLKEMGVSEGEIDVGQVYKTLRCLESLGHVRSCWSSEPAGQRRREYELTVAGRVALDEWGAVMRERERLIDEFRTLRYRAEGARQMMTGPDTIHEEHEAFRPRLDEIEALADAIGTLPPGELYRRAADIEEFLAHTVMPHAVAEGVVVFPLIRKETGEPTIGVRMTECHVELSRLTDELDRQVDAMGREPSVTVERDMRKTLYGVHALLRAHLAEQDEQIEPLLEANLPKEEREALFAAVERTAKEVADQYE
jgi:PadR family transcriptional regulator PadR